MGSRLGPRGGLLWVRLGLSNEGAVLQLTDRLVRACHDPLAVFDTVEDLEVLLAGYTHFYGPEGHFVVRSDHEHAFDVLLADFLGRLGLTESDGRVSLLDRLVFSHREGDDRH